MYSWGEVTAEVVSAPPANPPLTITITAPRADWVEVKKVLGLPTDQATYSIFSVLHQVFKDY